ncbi:MAG: tetratricopeptide repeat protein [Methanothrix sp.]|nr:tetratricopeptide repeat protein [Methanothrix sp.]
MMWAVILTALQVEYLAVRKHLTDLREDVHKGTVYQVGHFSANGKMWNVAIAQVGRHSESASAEAERSINHFNPKAAIFIGVAGGIKDVAIGDVVAATKVYGYEAGKAKDEFLPTPEVYRSSHAMEQRAKAVARETEWLKRINGATCNTTPKAFVEPIAAGAKVIKSTKSNIFEFLKSNYSDAIAVEMEGLGFFAATHVNPNVNALIIRGISDLIDGKDNADAGGSQEIASQNASAFAFEILATLNFGEEDSLQASLLDDRPKNGQIQKKSSTSIVNFPSPGELPEPGLFPIGSIPPFPRNQVFTGRETELETMASILFYSSNVANGAVIIGWRGVGKSQLAAEFSYRYGRSLKGVHWIKAEQDLASEIAGCGSKMSLPDWPDKLLDQMEMTSKAWRENGLHLVVMDNVESPQTVQDWMPKFLPAKILITSFRNDWPVDLGLDVIYLDVLPTAMSKELLRKLAPRLGTANDEELEVLASRLGNFPLALDVAGRYLKRRSELSLGEYLSELEKVDCALEHTSLKNWGDYSPTKHINPAATVILSWKQLGNDEIDILAKRLFCMCGYCAPNTTIPRQILTEALNAELSDQEEDKALLRLDSLGLAALTDTGPRLHTLLAEFARLQDQKSEESILASLANGIIAISNNALESGLLEKMNILREHLTAIAQASEKANLQTTGALWNNLGSYQQDLADYQGARRFFDLALKSDLNAYGQDHPKVAIDVNNLGALLQALGELEEARKCFERALTINEKVYGPDNPRTATDVNNLGTVLKDLGDFNEARKCIERALNINIKTYGPDHPKVSIAVNNLGTVLQAMGELKDARKCFERALEIDEKSYGPDHINVALRLNNLGAILQALSEFQEARMCYEKAIKIDKKAYGLGHPVVAADFNNLGTVLMNLGDFNEAKKCFEIAMEIDEKTFASGHPIVAAIANNLGSVLLEQGDIQGAKKYMQKALEINNKIYGPNHLDVAKAAYNMGVVLISLRDQLGAKRHFKSALDIYEKSLGPDHPITKEIRGNLRLIR